MKVDINTVYLNTGRNPVSFSLLEAMSLTHI